MKVPGIPGSFVQRGRKWSWVHKNKWHSLDTDNLEKAVKKVREMLSQAERGVSLADTNTTLGDYLLLWLEAYAEQNVARTTLESYRMICEKHLIPALGEKRLYELTPLDVQRYFSEKAREGLSSTTVRYHYRVLRLALDHAVDWGFVVSNVAKRAKPPRKADFEPVVWSTEDCIRFMQTLKKHRMFPFYATLLVTGMRRGEVVGLRWSGFDPQRGLIEVSRTVVCVKGGLLEKAPKTKRGRRIVAVGPTLVQILEEQREVVRQMRAKAKVWEEHDLIFPNKFGRPMDPHNISGRQFPRLCAEAGVPRIRLHDLRHTHLTELIVRAGVPMKIASERAGHSSVAFTADVYTHNDAAVQRTAAIVAEERLLKGVVG